MKMLGALAPAWMIIVGALMIIPYNGGVIVECIACGLLVTRILGVITILIGVGALAGRRGPVAG
jgi:hypothetical protein